MNSEDSKILIAIYVTDKVGLYGVENARIKGLLLGTSSDEIFALIKNNCDRLIPVSAANIPQFSNADDLPRVIEIVRNASALHSFVDIGHFLISVDAKDAAKRKYGENHYKLATQLGLTESHNKHFALTQLGEIYYSEKDPETRLLIAKKLALRIPIIQKALMEAEFGGCDLNLLMQNYLSKSTALRRRSNVTKMLSWVSDISSTQLMHLINRVIWKD